MSKTKLFLDSSTLIAYFNVEDEFHAQGCEIINKGETLYTCDTTLLEVQYVLWRELGVKEAFEAVTGLLESEDIEVIESGLRDLLEQAEIFRMHPMPSFDSLICAVMRREGIEYLASFDRVHFDAVPFIKRVEKMGEMQK